MLDYLALERQFPSACHKLAQFREAFNPELPGDFAEFGVANGNGSRELAQLDPLRTVWAFDTFEGMPSEDYHPDEDFSDPPGKWKPAAQPDALFAGIANIRVMQGRFVDTIPQVPGDVRFVLVHLDCDYYDSYTQALTFLTERLTPGATIFLDDYHVCRGATRAVDEWLARTPRATRNGDRITWALV